MRTETSRMDKDIQPNKGDARKAIHGKTHTTRINMRLEGLFVGKDI